MYLFLCLPSSCCHAWSVCKVNTKSQQRTVYTLNYLSTWIKERKKWNILKHCRDTENKCHLPNTDLAQQKLLEVYLWSLFDSGRCTNRQPVRLTRLCGGDQWGRKPWLINSLSGYLRSGCRRGRLRQTEKQLICKRAGEQPAWALEPPTSVALEGR